MIHNQDLFSKQEKFPIGKIVKERPAYQFSGFAAQYTAILNGNGGKEKEQKKREPGFRFSLDFNEQPVS